jgi:NAD(P)-dependent dehydrogenase (short-subunit alcohol dehydrogenase family)
MLELSNKRIIVGGTAPEGMGGALAVRLVSAGARVIAGDVSEANLKELAPELSGKPGKATTVVFDIADDDSIKRLVARSMEEMGGIDGLAIAAADMSKATMGNDHTVLDTDVKIWERTLRVNLIGHSQLMRAAIPHMIKGGGGSIVVISSEASHLGMDYMPAYSASKAGLQALVRHVARLCGKDHIRCNGVYPGLVHTRGGKVNMGKQDLEGASRNLFQRPAKPDDVARLMAFLLSDDSAWITGQIIAANGGVSLRE